MLTTWYTEPPAVHTMVEQRSAPGPQRDTLPQVYEVREVQSC